MTSLALRKKLLLAECEINRERFFVECQSLVDELCKLKGRFSGMRSAMASAAAGVRAIGEVREACSKERGSWLSTLLTGVRAGTSIWQSMRARR